MREYKFRGKAKMSQKEMDDINIPHQNGWVFGNLIIDNGGAYIVSKVIECDSEYIILGWWVKVHAESVGQYTGLKDKNGKEIYEGDICKDEENMLWEVIFDDGCFKLENVHMPGRRFIREDIEVISNIYENPELMEVE